jgi:hypothetical protein
MHKLTNFRTRPIHLLLYCSIGYVRIGVVQLCTQWEADTHSAEWGSPVAHSAFAFFRDCHFQVTQHQSDFDIVEFCGKSGIWAARPVILSGIMAPFFSDGTQQFGSGGGALCIHFAHKPVEMHFGWGFHFRFPAVVTI